MATESIYCLCGQPYDASRFMIQCDMCRDWYHGSCVGLKEYMAPDLDKYYCPRCYITCGPSKFKVQTNWHRYDPYEDNAEAKPVQTGTPIFIKELMTRHFARSEEVVVQLSGEQLTLQYLQETGFDRPILVPEPTGLDIMIPPDDFNVYDVERYVGSDREIDVIDVTRQADIKMPLHDFTYYYVDVDRTKIFNVISLEISNTGLSQFVEAPYIARELDWVNYVWPKDIPEDAPYRKPEVQKYCLMGVKDSYTDFHVDFGGSSVWYHVLKGQKIFYLIRPTPANMSLYQRWMTSSTRSETFFADQVDMCYKCVMTKGETMLIPTGWIHAVLTPVDSLVFGGNFLHSLNIPMQLQVYEIEKKIKTPGKFCFPSFETTNWYAARQLLEEMKLLNNQGRMIPSYLLMGVKALILTLKQWSQDKDYNKIRREQIPEEIESQKLLKELAKEVRNAERFLNSLNPPKPERESKRKKKKPVNADFVDFTDPQNSIETYSTTPPLKLTIRTVPKTVRKATSASQNPTSRPPLKLTLPKPVTYPYSSNVVAEDDCEQSERMEGTAVLTENVDKLMRRPWSALGDLNPVKTKPGELKLRLPKHHVGTKVMESATPISKGFSILHVKLDPDSTERSFNESVYDFHEESDDDKIVVDRDDADDEDDEDEDDDDEDDDDDDDSCDRLLIDEKPKRKINKISPFRMKMALMSDGPKNGIDELLKASGYAIGEGADPNVRLDDIESVQASPSTKEAIAGMLSMSMSTVGDTNSSTEGSSPKSRGKRIQFSDDYGENIDKVHQDDDYIYPALDASDDEDVIFKPRGRRKLDEAWSPKARVGPLVPKTDRPMREGTKKQSVEKGLEAAAAKRAGLPAPKRPYNRKKIRVPSDTPSTSTSVTITSDPSPPKKIDAKLKKPRKGMATAKQRLGKILKIHKMKF